jgi:hypothetical protein
MAFAFGVFRDDRRMETLEVPVDKVSSMGCPGAAQVVLCWVGFYNTTSLGPDNKRQVRNEK